MNKSVLCVLGLAAIVASCSANAEGQANGEKIFVATTERPAKPALYIPYGDYPLTSKSMPDVKKVCLQECKKMQGSGFSGLKAAFEEECLQKCGNFRNTHNWGIEVG
ncbi:uncharacterized protein LOC114534536 [Dendronephthya gigantea]|uniref:uncharacterized protein LOC114530761 n=1 Tax=Dendronephthya gigantea TaxID=151771 RepID=UPI00106C8937|nr:uncharacterized protein LOC114530761 [Dendronephthya gigantea]XP_028411796.1 uncharacterized protein LOC114534536 [Dendronephthya gigantea]